MVTLNKLLNKDHNKKMDANNLQRALKNKHGRKEKPMGMGEALIEHE